jgi:hypothetical protein
MLVSSFDGSLISQRAYLLDAALRKKVTGSFNIFLRIESYNRARLEILTA